MTKTIEQILGVTFPAKRSIPGTQTVEGREYCYIEYSGDDFDSEFLRLVQANQPTESTNGGAITGGCELTLPDGRKFHAMSYKGDLLGWCKQVEIGAKMLGRLTARISDEDLYVVDSSKVPLASCNVRFY